jgi:hypothetical protein
MSLLVTHGGLEVELKIRKGEAVGRLKQFEEMGTQASLSA